MAFAPTAKTTKATPPAPTLASCAPNLSVTRLTMCCRGTKSNPMMDNPIGTLKMLSTNIGGNLMATSGGNTFSKMINVTQR